MNDVHTVADVVARMQAIEAQLGRRDGVAVFNRVYLQVTEMVAERLAGRTTFRDDALMAELDIRFARLWFAAHDAATATAAVPKAWDPLFDARRTPGILPIQFALAGMNAHIEHDLPVAVVATCVARGVTPSTPGVREDYELVNDLLAEVEGDIRRSFLTKVGRAADGHLGPVAHLVSAWNIDKARELAWANTLALWELRRVERVAQRYAGALARTVGMGSRLLLTPLAT